MIFDEGSFRDPAGQVFYHSNKVYRIVNQTGKKRIDFLNSKDLINKSSKNNFLIESRLLNGQEIKDLGFKNEEINTFNLECKFLPGINQFMNISFTSSGIAEI